ncbi:MAG: NB-ARC domain-containing protein [Chloroflexales bacterium]|nr:NB-ARC domain-containing protein [Chloroflexales bacterium]
MTLFTVTRQEVRQALKHWHSASELGQLPLASLPSVTALRQQQGYADSSTGRGMALRHLLRAQIAALKPPDDPTPDYSKRQWRSYLILQAQFVDQRAAQTIREELGISESGYFNDQRYALDLLAQRLQEQEVQQAAQTRTAETTPVDEQPLPASQPQSAPLLPHAPTTFVGRQKERAQLAELLARQSVQLVTLFGAGGMGKTWLAIQAAQDYHEATGEPVCFVALETTDTDDSLVPIIAQAVQLSFDAQDDPRQQLRNFLRGRSLLLVLDNMEHLLPQAGEFLQDMLTVAPLLRVLVTSRERLNLRSEWVLALPGLDVPPPEVEQTDLLAEYSAVQLFLSALARGRGQSEANAVAESDSATR